MRALVLCLVAVSVALGVAGCGDFLEPTVGSAVAARCLNEDTDTSQPVTYVKDIKPLFEMRCRNCHFPTGMNPIGIQSSRLDLSSFETIMAGGVSGPAVMAGMPCASPLYFKVAPGPPSGSRMPLNGPPFLSDTQIALIHDWILEGALEH